MAKGSSSGGSQGLKRKNSKSSRANRNQPTSDGSDTANVPRNMSPVDHNKPQLLAPPSDHEPWTVKNPIPLILEILVIIQMFFVTLFFKTFRILLPSSRKSVKDHVVLITGSGRGLGRELALEFARLGAKVACVDVEQTSNEETVQLIKTELPEAAAKAYTVNVAVSSETSALATKVETDLGPVDVLINNAAVIIGHTFLGAQDHTVASIININLLGQFWMIRSFLPSMMKRNSGHIVAISSMSSLNGSSKLPAYTASKWGVNGMMESLREELREHSHNKIHTTVVIPRLINTSADYMKYIESRLPALSVEQAAKSTVSGILANEVEFTIPRVIYFTNIIRRMLPVNISDSIRNIFYVKVVLPEQENQDSLPNMSIINRTTAAN